MRRLLPLITLIGACAPEPTTIPADHSAVCADSRTCRSVTVGHTLVRGHAGQKLFTELVTDDPRAFTGVEALSAALAAANAEVLTPDPLIAPPRPELCPAQPNGRVIEALHRDLIQAESRSAACAPNYQARYVITVRPDGAVACIENRFAYSCV